MPSNNVNNNNDFFSQVSTQGLPEKDQKAHMQPWKEFHEPDGSLITLGSVVVEIPKTEETGKYA